MAIAYTTKYKLHMNLYILLYMYIIGFDSYPSENIELKIIRKTEYATHTEYSQYNGNEIIHRMTQ